MAVIFLTTVGTNTWTVPNDWNNSNNTVECIGSGADGVQVAGTGPSQLGGGGGGGAYAKKANISLTLGSSVNYKVGNPGSVNTWFNGSSITSCSVGAVGASGVNGGAAGSCVGDVRYSGGTGYIVSNAVPGGGAAGPNGSGVNGSSTSGGAGDAGWGGAGSSTAGSPGNNGNEWGTNIGSGGGGFNISSFTPSNGGLYGAGGCGSRSVQTGSVPITYGATTAGNGSQGIIRIVYTPVPAPSITTCSPAVGSIAGGIAVTITGSNFTSASSVKFGGVAATNVVVVNDSTITCKTPAHAVGLVSISITTPPGTGTKSNAYQYIAGPTFRGGMFGM